MKVKDLISIQETLHKDNFEKPHFINRMHLSANSSGDVHFSFNICIQSDQYKEKS